ncbi:MAG TPA: transcription termination factor NusA [Aggregatilinea sp.]|jgi:N utilization substance protein A|uniref:transcription termination factor NusA n=1 Tax=Aggregatilinea sp. TaxID=2806333 RepID=UPI002C306F3A|nr:transcription termination factor NusA [Aggregatilinea sp.]HML22833.1 transcription termination factor NusA [Aggregatilinea sp.]
MKSDFTLAFNEIVETRALPREVVLEALSQALISAYRRDANVSSNQKVDARIDMTGHSQIYLEKEVSESVVNEQTEVTLDVARELNPDAQLGDTIMVPVQTRASFGRIAAQTAKQVILQRIREAERETLYDEFVEREGDLVTGTVQSVTSGALTVSLGRAEAVMPRAQQIPGERYRHHDKIRAYVMEVKKNSRGPQIVVSRAHKNMLRRLLEYEVPEIYNGQVEIKNIAREAGHRSKVAVAALQEGVDPVGACVGMRGIRIQNIVKELSDEKIDVIEWSADPAVFIAKALSPARVSNMLLEEDPDTGRTATVLVPDDQLSLAIGREGQNARLAAKLTGWRIDIKSVSEAATTAFDKIERSPLSQLRQSATALIDEVARIIEKKRANRPIQPEEFRTLTDFAGQAEELMLQERESSRSERKAMLDTVRALVPERAFTMDIGELELDEDINRALSKISNVGDLMVRMLAEEAVLEQMLRQGGAGEDAMEAIRFALDDLVILSPEEEAEAAAAAEAEAEAVAEAEVEAEPVAEAPQPVAAEKTEPLLPVDDAMLAYQPSEAVEEEEDLEATLPAFVEPEPAPRAEGEEEKPRRKPAKPQQAAPEWERPAETDDEASKSKSKKKRRELVFDEERGEVVAKRRRKRTRGSDDSWEEYL